jgi:hypothetical protein
MVGAALAVEEAATATAAAAEASNIFRMMSLPQMGARIATQIANQ